ncbi:hypothetical protein ACQ858_13915 [Variovorax ureilyticus]
MSAAVVQHPGFIHRLRKPIMTTSVNWFDIPVADLRDTEGNEVRHALA